MNRVLSEIITSGEAKTADGTGALKVRATSVSSFEGEFLQGLVRQVDPTVSIEVGLAYGVSALYICDALKPRSGTKHIVIDPNQHGSWGGIGISNLRRAGYGDIVQLVEAPSYRALPELERSAYRVDFAFIDGWHTFDFVLVDFFFLDRMLKVGGVVAFDDANWPAIHKVCRFVKNNLTYSMLDLKSPWPTNLLTKRYLEHFLYRAGLRRSCIAFRKEADDSRRWDHFKGF